MLALVAAFSSVSLAMVSGLVSLPGGLLSHENGKLTENDFRVAFWACSSRGYVAEGRTVADITRKKD